VQKEKFKDHTRSFAQKVCRPLH